jgi:3-dehydroquinate dehydratase/shikimate dehydrogenase
MNSGKICISICSDKSTELLRRIDLAAQLADVIELRLDCLDTVEIESLLNKLPEIPTQYLITFRPRKQGGHSDADRIEREKFWSYAMSHLGEHDFLVDHEGDIDFPLKLSPDRTIVSLHDFDNTVIDLPYQFEVLSQLTGKTIKIAVTAMDSTDAIEVWNLLAIAEKKNLRVIPIAMGEAGKWTRVLGLAHGSPMTYASLDAGDETAPGQIAADVLRDVYRVKELDRNTRVYSVIAGDTSYSLSPYMHNAAFKARGLNAVFIPMQVADLDAVMRRMVKGETREIELNFHGFSVTNPHKQSVMNYLDRVDETARTIGAVNTVMIENNKLHGYNTDAAGFIRPLTKALGDLSGARVSVVGAGGAARACVYALKREGADVTLLVRDPQKASALADEFDVAVEELTNAVEPLATDILVNATPLGTRGSAENETIATADAMLGVKLVCDLVYNPIETRLLREAKLAGARTVGGLDMLIAQGAKQFEIWSGQAAPLETMRRSIEGRLR